MLVNTRISKCLGCGGKMKPKPKRKIKMKSGGKPRIYIKPSKRGSFTAWCKSHGFGGVNSSCIAAGKRAGAAIKKKAVFAQNARKWKHEQGGKLELAANMF